MAIPTWLGRPLLVTYTQREKVRSSAEERAKERQPADPQRAGAGGAADGGSGSDSASASSGDEGLSDGSASDSDAEGAFDVQLRARRRAYDTSRFSSALHEDVSRVLGRVLGVDHHNRIAAGPLTVDACARAPLGGLLSQCGASRSPGSGRTLA